MPNYSWIDPSSIDLVYALIDQITLLLVTRYAQLFVDWTLFHRLGIRLIDQITQLLVDQVCPIIRGLTLFHRLGIRLIDQITLLLVDQVCLYGPIHPNLSLAYTKKYKYWDITVKNKHTFLVSNYQKILLRTFKN